MCNVACESYKRNFLEQISLVQIFIDYVLCDLYYLSHLTVTKFCSKKITSNIYRLQQYELDKVSMLSFPTFLNLTSKRKNMRHMNDNNQSFRLQLLSMSRYDSKRTIVVFCFFHQVKVSSWGQKLPHIQYSNSWNIYAFVDEGYCHHI